MAQLQIEQIPTLGDNYVYLLHEPQAGMTAVVDPGVAAPVLERLRAQGRRLDWILSTHHHSDHTGGNLELKQATGCRIAGPKADAARIPGIDLGLAAFDRGQGSAQLAHLLGQLVDLAAVLARQRPEVEQPGLGKLERGGIEFERFGGGAQLVLGLAPFDHGAVERGQRLGKQRVLGGDPVEPTGRAA